MDTFGPALAEFLFHCAAGKIEPAFVKKVQSLSAPDIQIMTGAASATVRNRSSLSRRFSSARLRSVMSSITPILRDPSILESATVRPFASTQCSVPSGNKVRNSP